MQTSRFSVTPISLKNKEFLQGIFHKKNVPEHLLQESVFFIIRRSVWVIGPFSGGALHGFIVGVRVIVVAELNGTHVLRRVRPEVDGHVSLRVEYGSAYSFSDFIADLIASRSEHVAAVFVFALNKAGVGLNFFGCFIKP